MNNENTESNSGESESNSENQRSGVGKLEQGGSPQVSSSKLDVNKIYPIPNTEKSDLNFQDLSITQDEKGNKGIDWAITILGVFIITSPFLLYIFAILLLAAINGPDILPFVDNPQQLDFVGVIAILPQLLLTHIYSLSANIPGVMITAATILLGMGIIFRKELARIIYVFLLLFSLVMAPINIYLGHQSFEQIKKSNEMATASASAARIASFQKSIDKFEENNAETTDQRTITNNQEQIRFLQEKIEDEKKREEQRNDVRGQFQAIWYLALISNVTSFFFSVALIIFLTRRGVKKQFH